MCWLEFVMRLIEAVYEKPAEGQASIPLRQDALPEIPPMYRAEPAVLEAERIVQGRSISRAITDGRVIR